MTPINMAKHRNNPNMPFWKMIKEGWDHFEVTRQEPKVDFCEKKYVFDAKAPEGSKRDPVFDASAKCPVYAIPDDIADAVREKQQRDQVETAKLISKGTPVARTNTGIDGGMHRVFAAKLPEGSTGLSEGGDGQGLSLAAISRAPGTIPAHVNPPRGSVSSPEEPLAASMAAQTPASAPATRVASAAPTEKSEKSDGFFSSLARKVGLGGSDTTATTQPAKPKVIEAKRNEPVALPKVTAAVPKPAEHQAGRSTAPAAEAVAVGCTRACREGRHGRRFAADRAGELRQPLLGGEVSNHAQGRRATNALSALCLPKASSQWWESFLSCCAGSWTARHRELLIPI